MTDADWREFGSGLGDGIVNSTNPGGSSDFQVALSAGDRSVVLNLGQIRIRGVQFRPTPTNATVTFTLPTVAAGMTRSDRIVARYDPAAADTDKITFLQLNGTAVTTGSPVARPAITRVAGGVWDIPLHLFTGTNVTSNSLDREDHRVFVTSHIHALLPPGNNTALNQGYPDGTSCLVVTTGETWVQTYPGGVGTWTNLDDPAWADLDIGGGMKAGPRTLQRPQYRVVRGRVEMRGEGTLTSGAGWAIGDHNIGRLPASLYPKQQRSNVVVPIVGTGNLACQVWVNTDGYVRLRVPQGITVQSVFYDPITFPVE